MKCRFKKILLSAFSKIGDSNTAEQTEKLNAVRYTLYAKPAFSLIEAVTALIILALVSSSVLTVYSRCVASAADSVLRMNAFEVVRENMETLLASDSVKEMAEFGSSDKYPEIQWQTTVETFYEPITARMWIQATCSAEYTDAAGDTQTVELTHWLTDLTEEQLRQILEEQQRQEQQLPEQIIETEQEAADYAGVDVETIQQWVEDGMLTTEDGYYIKQQLNLYKQTDEEPTIEDKNQQPEAPKESTDKEDQQDEEDDIKTIGGRTFEELVEEGYPRELLERLFNRPE